MQILIGDVCNSRRDEKQEMFINIKAAEVYCSVLKLSNKLKELQKTRCPLEAVLGKGRGKGGGSNNANRRGNPAAQQQQSLVGVDAETKLRALCDDEFLEKSGVSEQLLSKDVYVIIDNLRRKIATQEFKHAAMQNVSSSSAEGGEYQPLLSI